MLVGTNFLDFEMSLRTYTIVIACLSTQASQARTMNTSQCMQQQLQVLSILRMQK